MNAWTPGPWSISPCTLETRAGQPFCGKYYVDGPHCSDGRFNEPDARLIAQAPAMAEILLMLVDAYDESTAAITWRHGQIEKVRDLARITLKQAGVK